MTKGYRRSLENSIPSRKIWFAMTTSSLTTIGRTTLPDIPTPVAPGIRACPCCKKVCPELEGKNIRAFCNTCRVESLRKQEQLRYSAGRKFKQDPTYHRAWRLRTLYGLTLEEYDQMVVVQGGQCAVCGYFTKLVVDHSHADGHVRGLLCDDCNKAGGLFKENPAILRKAADYFEVA